MTHAKYGTGILVGAISGARSATRQRAGSGVVALSAAGGIAGRGRAVSARVASGPKLIWHVKTGAAVSARVAAGFRRTRGNVAVLSASASGVSKHVRALDIPDSLAWFTHAVSVRKVARGTEGSVVGSFLGEQFAASWDGMNVGENGHAGGSWERRLYEEGDFRVRLPNRAGADGKLHRERFRPRTDPFFRPGDEWVEIYDRGDLVYVGATRDSSVSLQEVEVTGSDGAWLLRKTREYWSGYWNHAPRDVWEHYLSLWKMVIADDFSDESRFTYSGSEQTTSDGKWKYLRAGDGGPDFDPPDDSAILLYSTAPTGGDVNLRARIRAADAYAFPVGLSSATRGTAWRVECQFWRNRFGTSALPEDGQNAYVRVGMWDLGANDALLVVQMQERFTYISNDGGHTLWRTGYPTDGDDTFQMVLEGRDRWIFAFLNQRFIGAIAMPEGTFNCVPFVAMRPGASTAHQRVRVESFSCRRTIPYLRPTSAQFGDYRLPGLPARGGLLGTYFNDLTIKQLDTASEGGTPNPNQYALTIFSPWHKKTAAVGTRTDPYINFTTDTTDPYGRPRQPYQVNPPTWQNPGSVVTSTATGIPSSQVGKWFSVRWTGSVYLPLKDSDCQIRVTTGGEGFRLWVGKTLFIDKLLDTWLAPTGSTVTSGSLRSHIGVEADGTYHNGWFPILFEYGQRGSGGASVKLEYSVGGGWQVIPPDKLSPMGIFDDHVRMDTHWEVLNTLSETFGYQFTCEPRQFESAEFPGVMVPRVRVGRDTEKIVDEINAADYRSRVTGDTVADSILTDGQGLGSDDVQQVLEAMDYENIMSTLFIHSEYESWGDMAWEPSLAQRSNSLLALRSSPWEEIEARPFGAPEMLDTFPLTGQLALFRWEPGDGVRIVLPVIGVEDSQPRQILGVTFPFVPEGRQGPAVNFKLRPRGWKEFLRRVQRQYMAKQRNYQKQVMAVSGSLAAFGGSSLIDEFSRVPLPHDLSDVIRAEVTVFEKPDDSNWYLWINGKPTTHPPIQYPGKYDITGYIDRWNNLPIMRVEFRNVAT